MMRTKLTLFALMFMSLLFSACKKDSIEYDNDFDKSYKAWLNFKESSGNSYHYKMTSGSWTGSTTETVITVTDGKITKRYFKYTSPVANDGAPGRTEEWTEQEGEINTHAGLEALTLDQVYEKAKTDWLLKRKDASTYFEANNNGMISSCGYVDDNCADDCFNGIRIASVEAL